MRMIISGQEWLWLGAWVLVRDKKSGCVKWVALQLVRTMVLLFTRNPNENSHMRFFVEFAKLFTLTVIVYKIFGRKFSKIEFLLGFQIRVRLC